MLIFYPKKNRNTYYIIKKKLSDLIRIEFELKLKNITHNLLMQLVLEHTIEPDVVIQKIDKYDVLSNLVSIQKFLLHVFMEF